MSHTATTLLKRGILTITLAVVPFLVMGAGQHLALMFSIH